MIVYSFLLCDRSFPLDSGTHHLFPTLLSEKRYEREKIKFLSGYLVFVSAYAHHLLLGSSTNRHNEHASIRQLLRERIGYNGCTGCYDDSVIWGPYRKAF